MNEIQRKKGRRRVLEGETSRFFLSIENFCNTKNLMEKRGQKIDIFWPFCTKLGCQIFNSLLRVHKKHRNETKASIYNIHTVYTRKKRVIVFPCS